MQVGTFFLKRTEHTARKLFEVCALMFKSDLLGELD